MKIYSNQNVTITKCLEDKIVFKFMYDENELEFDNLHRIVYLYILDQKNGCSEAQIIKHIQTQINIKDNEIYNILENLLKYNIIIISFL